MHISLGEVDTSRWPVVLPGASGHYLLAFDDGRIVAGATRETGSGFDYRITPAGLAEILEQALAIAPGARAVRQPVARGHRARSAQSRAVRPARVGLSPLRMWVPCPWHAAWRRPTIALMGFLDDRARRDLEKERVQ
jgi:hypothetical protein